MSYYDPIRKTEFTVDASPVGLGAILAQLDPKDPSQKHIVAYASRSLSTTEQAYSQAEKEGLAVVWACEHFHLFLYGKPFQVVTDHQALLFLYGNPQAKMPPRIARWGLRLQDYAFEIIHRPGKGENPADFLSRRPREQSAPEPSVADRCLRYLIHQSAPEGINMEALATETEKDAACSIIREGLESGLWRRAKERGRAAGGTVLEEVERLLQVKEELAVSDDHLLVKDCKLVIPQSMRTKVIELAHETHRGMVSTKRMLRQKVWFPHMDNMVEAALKAYPTCCVITPNRHPEPLLMSELPQRIWEAVAADFFGPIEGGKYVLAVMDKY